MSEFDPSFWLPGPHGQTVWGRLARPRRMVAFRREVLPTPDGDEIVLDHLDAPARPDAIHFILVHGLEGSSYSVYIQGLLSVIKGEGYSATAMNFRSCAVDPHHIHQWLPNKRPRLYHSGETGDLDLVLRTLAARMPGVTMVAFGASLGGNALLKWLGEHPQQSLVVAGAAISVPYDLAAGAKHLETRIGLFYTGRFLRTLRKKVRGLCERFPEPCRNVDLDGAMRARTFRSYDDAATAPLHGFTGADDYYARSSSIFFLGRIATPTLCVSAEDDPFLPSAVLPRVKDAASEAVELRITRRGGHIGFVAGPPWRCRYWAEELVVRWLIQQSSRVAAAR
ncbi:MAG TPA: alpha/beta fold hydrolase [Thermoanaerobaculia bacterium]|nr:alpha/beta fold hydrolase [Thermoanaerobaculia bacterium]